ncbi:hypothetical protein JW935_13740 [candidate division KSB1 bacterium]|nr:hypothetical protein [candidate division KSB1 bacterium]
MFVIEEFFLNRPFYDSVKNNPEWGYRDVTDEPMAEAAAGFLKRVHKKPL